MHVDTLQIWLASIWLLLLCHMRLINSTNSTTWEPDFKTFTVRTVVRLGNGGRYEFWESYSREQKRAAVRLSGNSVIRRKASSSGFEANFKNTIVHDSKSGVTLHIGDSSPSACSRIDLNDAKYRSVLVFHDIDFGLPDYIIGPAKWLFYAVKYPEPFERDLFKLDARNVESRWFAKELRTKQGETITMKAYFSIGDIPERGETALPLMITLQGSDERNPTTLSFFAPQTEEETGPEMMMQDTAALDQFVWPLRVKCLEIIQGRLDEDVPGLKHSLSQFSFKAKVTHRSVRGASESLFFVAFDNTLDMLRIEHNMGSSDPQKNVREIIDLNSGWHYYSRIRRDSSTSKELRHCLISKYAIIRGDSFNLAMFLYGTKTAFRPPKYVGRGRVRNSPTLIYAAHETWLPIWIGKTTIAEDKMGLVEYIKDGLGRDGEGRFMTFIHVKDTPLNEIARMEILHTSDSGETLYDQFEIDFTDFHWTLNSQSSSDEPRLLDLFSLQDDCTLSDVGYKQKAMGRVEILLEAHMGTKEELELMKDANRRPEVQMMFLNAIAQGYDLFVAMIQDFEVRHLNNLGDPDKQQLLVTFSLREHPTDYARLVSLGKGSRKGGETKFYNAKSLMDCYLEAVLLNGNTHFEYDSYEHSCWIEKRQPGAKPSNPFDLDGGGQDIFQVGLMTDENVKYHNRLLNTETEAARTLRLQNRVIMVTGAQAHIEAEFLVTRFNTGGLESGRSGHKSLDKWSTKIDFVGLLVDDWGSSWKSDPSDSLAKCRLACFADSNCFSYSFCVTNGGGECVLSKLNFGSKEIVDKIQEASQAIGSKTFKLKVSQSGNEGSFVNLIKRKTCSLYNKHYLDYFKSSRETIHTNLAHKLILPATNADKCAEFCMKFNMKKFIEVKENLRKTVQRLDESASQGQVSSDLKSFVEMKHDYCVHFDFVEMRDLKRGNETAFLARWENQWPKIIEMEKKNSLFASLFSELFASESKPNEKSNFCVFNDLSMERVSLQVTAADYMNHETTKYRFNPIYFYDELTGITLKSTLDADQARLIDKLKNAGGDVEISLEELRSGLDLVKKGENIQSHMSLAAFHCALSCMNQVEPWPACKSFDIRISYPKDQVGVRISCQLNSITYNEAVASSRTDLIDDSGSSHEEEKWHYEPVMDFGLSDVAAVLQEEAQFKMISLKQRTTFRVGALLTLTLMMFGIVTGFFGGAYLAEHIRTRRIRANSISEVLKLPPDIVSCEMTGGRDVDDL